MAVDAHNLGEFASISDAWKLYPNGGGFGDYITVNGVRVDWNEYSRSWGEQTETGGTTRPDEVVPHSIDVQGTGTFRDGVKVGSYVKDTSGANIDQFGNAEFRSVQLDALMVKYGNSYVPLSDFIKTFKTELPPDWTEYTEIPLFDDVRLLVFDENSSEKFYTTIGALKAVIGSGGSSGGGTVNIEIIRSDEPDKIPTDNNVFSALRTLLEITKAIKAEVEDLFLSKIDPDTAAGHITLNDGFTSKSHSYIKAPLDVDKKLTAKEGLQIGASFAGGLTGIGGFIDKDGKAELDALSLRKWLEVPELRYNRVEVTIGDKWSAPGAGIIESVDTENKVIKLKLEEGEVGTFDVDDICMGIYHSMISGDNATSNYDDSKGNRRFAGFATSYFRIIQVMDNQRSTLRYELRHISGSHPNPVHPSQFMHAVAYGNFTNADRQTSNYQTRTYTRYLKGVRDWEFTLNNIAAQFGNLDNLNIFGLEMSGYSIYLNNVYFTGIIHQLSQQIQDELNKQQIGGKNLLREYDIRFGFKYWGGTGDFAEVNLDTLQNQPYLNVSPDQILWVFPEREADVNVESNTNWLVE